MKTITLLSSLAILGIALTACKGYDDSKAREDRQEWITSLADTISIIEKTRTQDSLNLDQLREEVADRLQNFMIINNPREVEPYYILKAFRASYPLNSTGIAARVLKNEGMEIVAALTGKRFNAIRISSGQNSAESQIVPADQALNYTAGNLTTVAFSGSKTDSLAMLVAENAANKVKLEYLQNGNVAQSIILSQNQINWISETYSLCSNQAEIHNLENSLLISSRKLQILKLTLDSEKEKASKGNESK